MCKVVDSEIVKYGSGDRSRRNGPGRMSLMSWLITEQINDIGQHWMKRHDRSQSSHSSDEAVQQNTVERRGTGR